MIVVGEALMIGLLSWMLAALVAWPVGRAVGDFLVRMFAAALPYPQVNIEHLLVRSPSGLMADAQKLVDHATATIPAEP